MRFTHPRRVVAVALAIPALLLAACSSDAQSTPAANTEDNRTLVVYAGRSESLVGPLIEKFEEETGIEVKVRYANSIEMASQLLEEGERTPAQVFLSQEAGALGALREANLLVTLPEDITGVVESGFSASDNSWVALTGRTRVAIFDSKNLSAADVPTNLHDLTDPKWKGKIGIAPTNASFQSFLTAMRITEGEQVAEDWLRGLIANDVETFSGNGGIIEAVESSALSVGLVNHYYWVRNAAEAGGPENLNGQLQFGEPGTVSALINVTGAGILKGSEDSTEALEFVKYLVSQDAQKYFVTETGEYSLLPGAESPANVPAFKDLTGPEIDYSKLSDLEGTIELLQKVGLI